MRRRDLNSRFRTYEARALDRAMLHRSDCVDENIRCREWDSNPQVRLARRIYSPLAYPFSRTPTEKFVLMQSERLELSIPKALAS